MIRAATEADIPLMLELGRAIHEKSGLPVPYEPAAAERLFRGLFRCGGQFLSERGMIGGCVSPLPYGTVPAFTVALYWHAEDGRSFDLLDAFRAWAPLPVRFGLFCHDRAAAVARKTGCAVRETIMGEI